MMPRPVRGAVLLVLIAAFSARADAAIIDFTSFSLGPTADGVLHVGDVTISSFDVAFAPPTGAQAAVLTGVGLGLARDGSNGRIDRSQSPSGGSGPEGSLDILVNGTINAVTIQPYFTVIGGPPADPDQSLEISVNVPPLLSVTNYRVINAFAPYTLTLGFTDMVRLSLFTDFGPDPWLSPYIAKHGKPDGFMWGYAVTSLDYTPTDVPEPASIALLGIALAWMHRRRFAHRS